MNTAFLTKRIKLNVDYDKYRQIIDDNLEAFASHASKARHLAEKGCVDAPYLYGYQDLGFENGLTEIYKLTAPGWFYRINITGENWNQDRIAVLLSHDPNNLKDDTSGHVSNRLLYMTSFSDSLVGGGNNMFPVHPGTSTYACVLRKGSADFKILYVPSRETFCNGVRSEDLAIKVGVSTSGSAQGGLDPSQTTAIFSGDWKDNFRPMFGFNVANDLDTDLKFIGDAKDELIKSRSNWLLTENTVPLEDYTTIARSGSGIVTYKQYIESMMAEYNENHADAKVTNIADFLAM